jgi:ribonuclease HII
MGIDEAGRGPVIGPLVICGFVYDESVDLRALGAKDSKQLSPTRREKLAVGLLEVATDHRLSVITAIDIDQRDCSLNDLEINHMARLIDELAPDTVYVDAIQSDCAAFRDKLMSRLSHKCTIIAENKADVKFPVVSAASILAKVERDAAVGRLRKEYGDIGSGYPSDPTTRQWLRDWYSSHGSFPPVVRHTWATIKELLSARNQRSLDDF